MKINVEALKALVEAGDVSAIEKHILNEALEKSDVYGVLEKGDIKAAAEANKDVLSELDSIKDTHHQTALETFKKNQLPKLIQSAVDEKVKELNPKETPEQAKIRELEERLNKEQQQRTRAEVRSKLIELATSEEVGLDAVFVAKHIDRFVPSTFEANENGEYDIAAVVENVKQELVGLSTDFKSVVSAQVEQTMKGIAKPGADGGLGGAGQQQETLGEKLAKQKRKAQEVTNTYFK